jgi:carboxyl-terminal processing protease
MSKKIPISIAITLIFLFSALTVFLTVSVYLRYFNQSLNSYTQQTKSFEKFAEIDAVIRENYNGDTNANQMKNGSIKGYVEGLGDKNAAYYAEDEYERYLSDYSGHAQGTGITADYSSLDNTLIVSSVSDGSPAQANQLKSGDKIISVNGKAVSVSNYRQLRNALGTDSEKELNLQVVRSGGQATEQNIVNLRLSTGYQKVSVYSSVSNGIGYIRIADLYDNTAEEFSKAISSLSSQGMIKLIVDVRNNKSTNYDVAADIIDIMAGLATEGRGAIAKVVNDQGTVLKAYSSDTNSLTIKCAVLMNDRTEAAAELIAVDLREFLHASLVGERTAGNAGVQKTFILEDGSALILTVAKIYPYITETYDDTGIEPDIELVLPAFQKDTLDTLAKENDAQYNAAVSALES